MTAEQFETHRANLFGVAYRMLGSRVEAEDAVQEAWLRYAEKDPEVADLRGWLITVVARICLDVLRSARVRRENYVGPWLPEPTVERLTDTSVGDPYEVVARDEEVTLALLVVLERLSPGQRIAFVLHDAFAVPFEAIAQALGTSPANARQLATRGRRLVRDAGAETTGAVSVAEQRRVLAAFIQAADSGDLPALTRILAPDVQLVGDGGGLAPSIRRPLLGVEAVGRFVTAFFAQGRREPRCVAEVALINGALGFVVELSGSVFVIAPQFADGHIVAFYHILNPEKLHDVAAPDPVTASWPPLIRTIGE